MASASAALAPAPAPRRVAASRAARRARFRARAAETTSATTTEARAAPPASDDRGAADDASDDITSDDITACLPRADPAPPAAVSAFLARPGRHATFSASRVGAVDVREVPGERTLREYLSLPASEYNTLDGERVERVGEDTFVCQLGALDFLGFVLKPVLTAKVEVMPDGGGSVVRVIHAEVRGSPLVETANDMFEIDSVNRVGWRRKPTSPPGGAVRTTAHDEEEEAETPREGSSDESSVSEHSSVFELCSETRVAVHLIVPRWFPFTVRATERTGNFVVSQVVAQVVPRFLGKLREDYEGWAKGDDCREAACEGSGLFDVDVDGGEVKEA
jgi:hypothetical protein